MSQRILHIDDEADLRAALKLELRGLSEVFSASNLREGLEILEQESLDLALIDFDLGGENGVDAIKVIKQKHPSVDVVMLSGERKPNIVVDAIRAGASDFLTKPFEREKLEALLARATKSHQAKERYAALITRQNESDQVRQIISRSQCFQRLLEQAEQLKGYPANVLIVGETGTGKELLARYLHRLEENPGRPFVAVNCAAIPENLIESELFGAERGAYTGATQRRIGRFELADGGDIFLDEVSSLKLDLQSKILRVLQEKEFTRVGGTTNIRADFRVIAATNDQLDQMVSRGEFRIDLYHRLRVIQLIIPSLRERPDDIELLVEHFLQKHAQGGKVKTLDAEAMERLMAYHWPGNVRELENVIQSLIILAPGDAIAARHLPVWALDGVGSTSHSEPVSAHLPLPSVSKTVETLKDHTLRVERLYIEHVLHASGGDKSKAARLLDVGRTTLYSKLREFGMME